MGAATRYATASAGDTDAIVDWEKQADLEFNYEAIYHTVTKYFRQHGDFITEKLANKKLLFKVNGDEETALHLAAKEGHGDVIWVLIEAARLLRGSPSSANDIISLLDDFVWHPNRDKDTALHLALTNGNMYTGGYRLIMQDSPPRYGHDIKNHLGDTPIYLAVKLGDCHSVREMCDRWKDSLLPLDGPDGFATVLHAAIIKFPTETGHSDVITYLIKARRKDMEMPYSGYEAIFDKTDKNYDTVLSLSVREHQFTVVELILSEDPAYRNGRVRKSNDLKSLISVTAKKPEKGYIDMVNLLIKNYQAKKDIGHAGQTALHTAIIQRDQESVFRLLREEKDLVSKADSERWTPLHYAAYYDFYSVLDATSVGYKAEDYQSANETWWVPTPLHVAAKQGHTSTLMKLMELLPASLYVAADSLSRQNILHLAVLAREKEMILHILEKCQVHINKILNRRYTTSSPYPRWLLRS